jgi:putative acetyltransferase
MQLEPASTPEELETTRALFRAYQRELNVDLCFQSFEAELATLPGSYAPPHGVILLLRDDAGIARGCGALRPLQSGVAEMKRLYVDARLRGHGAGRLLAEALLDFARRAGYREIVLDTLETMAAARKLYAQLGFMPTTPYYANPLPGVAYLRKQL